MLRVFVSSVSDEFASERDALRGEIHALGALFSGMEYFGSRPDAPAAYCARAAAESDVYVGLFGERYGSIDATSGLSFTHLEYEAARTAGVPCLVYLKGASDEEDTGEPPLRKLKEHLREELVASWFLDLEDLRLRFLRDFVKLLHERFLDRIVPLTQAPIPAKAFHAATRAVLPEQVQAVAGEKYIPELYVSLPAEQTLVDFAEGERAYLGAAGAILDQLVEISLRFHFAAEIRIEAARATFVREVDPETIRLAISDLEEAFRSDEIDRLRAEVERLIEERNPFTLSAGAQRLAQRLKEFGFVDRDQLRHVPEHLAGLAGKRSIGGLDQSSIEFRRTLGVLPSVERQEPGKQQTTIHLASDLLRDLRLISDDHSRRCAVVVARAGAGKSNLLCSVALRLSRDHPVLLLGGQNVILKEHGIVRYVQERLEQVFRGVFSDWLNRVSAGLQTTGQWLFILIDGINESEDIRATADMLREFLPLLSSRRVKVILTCRDLLWESYADIVRPYSAGVFRLQEFTDTQRDTALERYSRYFAIRGTVGARARDTLRNPLLLRLFCQVHRGGSIGHVGELRTLAIFGAYFDDVARRIAGRLRHVNTHLVEDFLLTLAADLWVRRSAVISLAAVRVSPAERSQANSVYSQLVDENVVREERAEGIPDDATLRYVYDEFFEYVLARAWHSAQAQGRALITEAVAAFDDFPAAFGALLYYDELTGASGSLVNELIRALARTPDPFAAARQARLLYAFERMNYDALDPALIAILAEFESAAIPDVKQRLAPAILRVGERAPGDPTARALVEKVLEIEGATQATSGAEGRDGSTRRMLQKWLGRSKEPKQLPEDVHTLPPGRFHYTEATRLSAIAVLAGVMAPDDPQRISGAITALGRTDLHSALEAIISLDRSSDRVVCPLVATYLDRGVPEYQIYCTWLLRERYGPEPATFLLRLLTATDTRVHRYAMKVLETRLVEEELLTAVLGHLDPPGELKPWHARNLLRVLGYVERLQPPDVKARRHGEILSTLSRYFDDARGSVRLEALHSATRYRPYLDLASFHRRLTGDDDVYVRKLARTLDSSGFFSWPG
ncbi:MAG: DUF4062 domain-containing protein [Longimicrobiaceae bacterium]